MLSTHDDRSSQLDTPIQHWDREWRNNNHGYHHNLLHHNATANVIYVSHRQLSSQLHYYVTRLIFSYLHPGLSIYLNRTLCLWFITAFHLHVAECHLHYNQADLQWHYHQCQYWTRQSLAGCDTSLRLLLYSPCWGWTDVLTVTCCQTSDRKKHWPDVRHRRWQPSKPSIPIAILLSICGANVFHNLSCQYVGLIGKKNLRRQGDKLVAEMSNNKKVISLVPLTNKCLIH